MNAPHVCKYTHVHDSLWQEWTITSGVPTLRCLPVGSIAHAQSGLVGGSPVNVTK